MVYFQKIKGNEAPFNIHVIGTKLFKSLFWSKF